MGVAANTGEGDVFALALASPEGNTLGAEGDFPPAEGGTMVGLGDGDPGKGTTLSGSEARPLSFVASASGLAD